MKKTRWQHVRPVGIDDPGYHEQEAEPDFGSHLPFCRHCHKGIKRVDENEGPEMLKAMFRL